MIIKKNKYISVSSIILSKEITEKQAEEFLDNLEKQNKVKKIWLIIYKDLLEEVEICTEKEIDELFERLKKKGIKAEDYFIKKYIYKVLEDITI